MTFITVCHILCKFALHRLIILLLQLVIGMEVVFSGRMLAWHVQDPLGSVPSNAKKERKKKRKEERKTLAILSKYKIISLNLLEQFFCSGNDVTTQHFCYDQVKFAVVIKQFLSNGKYITQITKVLSLILPIILVQVRILREVITSVITSWPSY